MQLVECVPNISEGRDKAAIDAIARAADSVEGARCLHVDSDPDANRTVLTLAGNPEALEQAILRLAEECFARIDMRKHSGVHPRLGALDVVPFVPLHGVRKRQTLALARKIARKLGEDAPVFLYGEAASSPQRSGLAWLRKGGYEGLEERLAKGRRRADFGPGQWSEACAVRGATCVGVRAPLVAFNVDLDTEDLALARDIALSVRERGRWMRKRGGRIVRDSLGRRRRVRGRLRGVRAIGWFLPTRGCAQVSMNLVDLGRCSVVEAFEAVSEEAKHRGVGVPGSELVGLIPESQLLLAAARVEGLRVRAHATLLRVGAEYMGLSHGRTFRPKERILEERLAACLADYQRGSIRALG